MASYRNATGEYTSIFGDFNLNPDQHPSSLGIPASVCDDDDDCDGFCPECRAMIICEAYKELKDEWDSFYS